VENHSLLRTSRFQKKAGEFLDLLEGVLSSEGLCSMESLNLEFRGKSLGNGPHGTKNMRRKSSIKLNLTKVACQRARWPGFRVRVGY
jgi:hypothetical protein